MARVDLCGYDIESSAILSEEELLSLFRQYRNGDRKAKDKIVMSNIRLVLSIVQRYRTRKMDIDDMFHTGVIGLLKAVEGFDEKFNVKFSTYAVPMIQGEIRRFVKDNGGIKVPRLLRDIAYKAMNFKNRFEQENYREPTMLEIANEIDVDESKVVNAFEAISDVISLSDEVYNNGEDSLTLLDQICDEKDTEGYLIDRITLKDGINNLPSKERKVIILRYFNGRTQVEISHIIGISQAQVSRLESQALKKLRDIMTV